MCRQTVGGVCADCVCVQTEGGVCRLRVVCADFRWCVCRPCVCVCRQ